MYVVESDALLCLPPPKWGSTKQRWCPSVCPSVCPMPIAQQEGHAVAGAGHLHINLAPNPQVTQLIERTLKLSANIGKLSKKTTLQVYQ